MARLICLLSALALAVGCQPIKLDPDPDGGILPGPDASRPSTLTIHGQVCTAPVDPSQFPVKIVFLIDSSGSMCISDGPGSQASSGLCETIGAQLVAQGITVPGRVRSLRAVIDSLKSRPEVSVALVPFDSKVNNAYPDSFAPSGFVPASDGALGARIDSLQNQLGKGTDYQGALAEARARIENDVLATIARGQRSILPRARYVVVMLTDGTPYPRCAADDNNPDPNYYATVDRPSGVWRDDPASFCNLVGEGGGQQQDNPECLGTDCSKPVEQNDGGTPECLGTDCNDAGLQPRPDAAAPPKDTGRLYARMYRERFGTLGLAGAVGRRMLGLKS